MSSYHVHETDTRPNILSKAQTSDLTDRDNDEDSDTDLLQNYHPSSAHFGKSTHNAKISRQLSRGDASSIIGGINVSSSNLSSTTLNSKRHEYQNHDVKDNWDLDSDEKFPNTDIEQEEDVSEESFHNDAKNSDTLKIFNFSLPFSSPFDLIDDIKLQPKKIASTTSNLPSSISKTIKKISNILPFNNDENDSSNDSFVSIDLLSRRSHHPKAPDPPPNVHVYWDEISDVPLNDEEREKVELKLERSLSLDTLQEAKYYRNIDKLDDGKFKALRQSIFPNTPSLSTLSNKFQQISVTKKIKCEPMAFSPTSESSQVLTESVSVQSDNLNDKILASNDSIYDEIDGDILIIGGYRGSVLRDSKTHRRTWVPVLKAGLNIKKINLQLGPDDEDEMTELHSRDIIFNDRKSSKFPKMYPDGMITHVGPVDFSKKLIKKLRSNPNVHLHEYSYDWRLSLDLLSEQLYEKLKQINRRSKSNKKVLIIAHSMGGLVSHGAMIKDPTMVRGIIYAGTPLPCSNILGPLRFSDSILLSRDVLTNQANFFMRSSFVFMPPSWGGEDENGNNGGMTLFRDLENGKRYKIDFWDVDNWVLYNLSPLVSSVRLKQDFAKGVIKLNNIKESELREKIKEYLKIKIDPLTEVIVSEEIKRLNEPVVSWIDSYNYLKRTIKRTQTFIKSLERDDNVNYPPMAQIFSNSVPSVKYSLVNGYESIKRGEYYKFFYGPGDGVLYQSWNFPREYGRERADAEDDFCETSGVDTVQKISDWRGQKYGYGERYSYKLCGKFNCEAGHVCLLADLKVVGDAIRAILCEEKKRLDNYI